MGTYQALQTRIADEIARTDLTEQIKKAVLTAVEFYRDDRFWFNEGEVQVNTEDGTANQTIPVTFGEIDVATVTVSGNRYDLGVVSYGDIRSRVLQTTLKGQPVDIAIFDEQIWYYPIPDNVYVVTLSGLVYFTELSANGNTNAWTTEAEQLIRVHAKADLFANIIRNDKEAQKMISMAEAIWSRLMKKTVQKIGAGRLKPIKF